MTGSLDKRTHLAFPVLVCVTAVLAVAAGATSSPPRDVPTYALDSAVVYRCEIAVALFLALYLFVAAVFLAIEGRTVGKVSTTGLELPSDLSGSVTRQQALIDRLELMQRDLAEQDERLSGAIDL